MSEGQSQLSGAVELDAVKTDAAVRAKPTVSHMLGEVTWLLSQSPAHKHFAIGDLEWLVMPAILLERFRVFHGDQASAWLSRSGRAFPRKRKRALPAPLRRAAAQGCRSGRLEIRGQIMAC